MVDPKELDIEIARLEYAESSYESYAKLAVRSISSRLFSDHGTARKPVKQSLSPQKRGALF